MPRAAVARVPDNILRAWEQDTIRPPPAESIADWAEREVFLPRSVSSMPGKISLGMTPYMRAPLEAATDPDVEEIVICSSAQVMKTTVLILVVLWHIANDPWNVLHVMPAEDEALEIKHERYLPIIHATPALSRFVSSKSAHQLSGDCIRLNGCVVTFRGSHSPSGLASKPIRIAIGDEIDKWETWTGKEGDPIDLMKERLKSFYDSKLLLASTPTTDQGRIMTRLRDSTNERYHVPCPHCGAYQALVFGDGTVNTPGLKWPREISPEEIKKHALAWYECGHCHEKIEERAKREMVARGAWVPAGCRVEKTGEVVGPRPDQSRRGFHIWAAYSPWAKASWGHIAAEWLASKDVESKRMNFINSWLADTYKITVAELAEGTVRGREGDYAPMEIPADAVAVTFGVDVQAKGPSTYHYFVVRAWGPQGKSWLLKWGVTTGWAQLNSVIYHTDYRRPDGVQLRSFPPVVDSGFRASEVYEWCAQTGALASKGDAKSRRHISHSAVPRALEEVDTIDLIIFNPDFYKAELHRVIREEDLWWVPRGVDEEYYRHLVAEQQVRRVDKRSGQVRVEWKLRSDGLPNHYLDAEILALVAADLAEIRHLRIDESTQPQAAPAARPGINPEVSMEVMKAIDGLARGPFSGMGAVRIF